MAEEYKNRLPLTDSTYGDVERNNLSKEILKNSTPIPKLVLYEDIDKAMNKWVEENLEISYEGKRLPLMKLYSNQRFSEYMQSWEYVDENKNLILNFKTISRENNPQIGTMNGPSKNIPGDPTFLLNRVEAYDRANRKYYIDYMMKQPMAIDLVYRVSIMTNKYELINDFNLKVNNEFKCINAYISPNDHYMSMTLDSISDESEYNINDRQFYSQSYIITVRGYVIQEGDISVVETPVLKVNGYDDVSTKAYAEIEEIAGQCPYNPYHNLPIKLTVTFEDCCDKLKFTMDCNFYVEKIEYNDNMRGFRLFVNDNEIFERENFLIPKNSKVKILHVRKLRTNANAVAYFIGFDKDEVYSEEVEILEKEEEFSC